MRRDEARHRLDDEKDRRSGDKGSLHHGSQRLGLAVPEAMLAVGGHQGVAHRDQVHQRGRCIEQRVDKSREDADRIGQEEGHQLHHDEQQGRRDRGGCGQPQQPRRLAPRRPAGELAGATHG